MAVVDLTLLKTAMAPGERLLGLDVGSRTVGLALSDTTLTIASPLTTIRRTKFTADAGELRRLIGLHGVGGLIVGLPVSMDGREGPQCQSVRQFAANLLGVIDRPLAFWDERLSTRVVERMLIEEADMSRRRRRDVVDKLAAAYILQSALDVLDRR